MNFVLFTSILTIWLTIGSTESAQISFNATKKYGVHYFAKEGDNVVLTCALPEGVRYADIYKEVYPFLYVTLVYQGVLYRDVGVDSGKYDLTITGDENGKEYSLAIRGLDKHDTAIYGCIFCVRARWSWICPYDYAYLHVVEDLDKTPEICTLVSGTNGLFFIGDDLILNCPEENLQISFNESDVTSDVMSSTEGDRIIYRIQIVDGRFNETTIGCVKISDTNDYCEGLPTISVFFSLEVKVTPESKEIPSGGNISFTCKSNPPMLSSLEWDLPDTGIMFDNISIIETPEGSRLTIENIDFRNSSQSYFEVTCNVTTGSQNAADVATIHKKIDPTTVMTSLDPITNKSNGGRTTIVKDMTTLGGGKGDTFEKKAVFIVSIGVIFVAFCVIVVVVICIKSSRASKQYV